MKKQNDIKNNNRNWKKYNSSLKNRGNINIWIKDIENINEWWYEDKGRNIYSNKTIEFILTLKFLYRLPLRNVIGFMESIFLLNNININKISIPDYSTLSRRAKKIKVKLNKNLNKDNIYLIVDSTGLKVFGEGEWKVRKHGYNYRRTWRKLHIAIDKNFEVRAVSLTNNDIHDSYVVDEILKQEGSKINTF